jgi:hypothetical protein
MVSIANKLPTLHVIWRFSAVFISPLINNLRESNIGHNHIFHYFDFPFSNIMQLSSLALRQQFCSPYIFTFHICCYLLRPLGPFRFDHHNILRKSKVMKLSSRYFSLYTLGNSLKERVKV